MNYFYVYVLCDPRYSEHHKYGELSFDCKPFYVGKGYKNRVDAHVRLIRNGRKSANPHKDRIISKILEGGLVPNVIKISEKISEIEAFAIEKEAIILIGRNDLGTGPLTNLSEGGEGNSGYQWTPEQRNKLKRAKENNPFFGKSHGEETKSKMRGDRPSAKGELNHFFGKHHTEQSKEILSQKNRGRKIGEFDSNHKQKIALALKGKTKNLTEEQKINANKKRSQNIKKYGHPHHRTYVLIEPNGNEIEIKNFKAWCFENKMNYRMLLYVAQGKYTEYKDYKCFIKELNITS